jgi:hypothetical protein
MTDIEKFVELYKSIGIEPIVFNENDRQVIAFAVQHDFGNEDNHTLSKLIDGYQGFYTKLIFNMAGTFLHQLVLE